MLRSWSGGVVQLKRLHLTLSLFDRRERSARHGVQAMEFYFNLEFICLGKIVQVNLRVPHTGSE